MTHGSGHQTDSCHCRCHNHRADTWAYSFFRGLLQRRTQFQIRHDVGNHNHTVLNTNTEQGNETDTCRNGEVEACYQKGYNPPHSGKWHIQQYQSGIPRIREQNKQDDKDDSNTDGNHLCQAFRGTLLVLEITCPFQRISCRKMYGCIHFFLCLGNCRTHVTASHRELHCTEACMIITENK